jgi:outer membrane protein OmpA-like peptidoglycan-associated protein
MKKKGESFFWTSFADLMTSLFFIVLVLYVLTYIMLKKKEKELINTVEDLKHKLEVYELVEQNLKPLKQDTLLFRYEEEYKRFTLAFDVNFVRAKSAIARGELNNYDTTSAKIQNVGNQLQKTIDQLARNKADNPSMKNVSYLVIISGYASHLLSGSQLSDYDLSYQRAYNLWNYWKSIGIDFEANKYKGLIDLQIAGNGWGGVGRFERDPQNFMESETKNQRFIIQIVPKIGNTNSE